MEILNFGCRLNAAEGERIGQALAKTDLDQAIVFNGCAVTAEAERKLRQSIRRKRREKPHAHIILTGCPATSNRSVYENMEEIDQIVDNIDKVAWAESLVKNKNLHVAPQQRTRFFLPIQNGCDHACTFCFIPQGRGASRSIPFAHLVKEIEKRTCQEIILTGVDISAYGLDLKPRTSLGELLKALIDRFPMIERWRLSSIDQAEFDETLLDLVQNETRVMPHIHLSLQSGSDLILKRMRRRHLRRDIQDLVEKLLAGRIDIVFGGDVIAGFPTETDAHFEETVSLIRALPIHWLHVFPFSPRPGTPAARMPAVTPAKIRERARYLRQLASSMEQDLVSQYLKTVQPVLIESHNRGYTPHYIPVKIEGCSDSLRGRISPIRLDSWDHINKVMIGSVSHTLPGPRSLKNR